MVIVFVRSPYNYDTAQASLESGLKCEDVSRTQQHQKEEADINTIVKRFGLTGELPSSVRVPQSGDFSNISDYHTAMNQVLAADRAFMELPADLRSHFRNSPEEYVEFCLNPENREELKMLGLLKEATVTEPPVVQAAPAPAQTPKA